jgi:hypothetical protein
MHSPGRSMSFVSKAQSASQQQNCVRSKSFRERLAKAAEGHTLDPTTERDSVVAFAKN